MSIKIYGSNRDLHLYSLVVDLLRKIYGSCRFIYTFFGLGIFLCLLTYSGHIAAETANGHCLSCVSFELLYSYTTWKHIVWYTSFCYLYFTCWLPIVNCYITVITCCLMYHLPSLAFCLLTTYSELVLAAAADLSKVFS